MIPATPARRWPAALLPLCLAALTACGGQAPVDPNNREIPWTYGPRTDDSTREHLLGSGTKFGAAIARGWQCRLRNGTELVVQPFELAANHPLFDKVVLSIGLFDPKGERLANLVSQPLTAKTAAMTFAVEPAVGQRLQDLVLYYVAKD
jgi:hypothetical protein